MDVQKCKTVLTPDTTNISSVGKAVEILAILNRLLTILRITEKTQKLST